MRIFIDATELPTLRALCALHKLELKHHTIPDQSGIVRAVVGTIHHKNGDDITPSLAFTIGREFESKLDLFDVVSRIHDVNDKRELTLDDFDPIP